MLLLYLLYGCMYIDCSARQKVENANQLAKQGNMRKQLQNMEQNGQADPDEALEAGQKAIEEMQQAPPEPEVLPSPGPQVAEF